MNTTFLINGGAGRVIASIPALEKFEKLNPNDDFKIIVAGFEQLFWSHPTLQKRTYGSSQKGLFETFIKSTKVVSPEPYQLHNFYNQKCNLVEAFDECINSTTDHSDLIINPLYFDSFEKNKAKEFIKNLKQEKNKNKVVVIQPYGSGAELVNGLIVDTSNRSLTLDSYLKIGKELSRDCVVIYASSLYLKHPDDTFSVHIEDHIYYLRVLSSVIAECDYFVGVCSVGQHIARTLKKPGLILMGATSEQNFSYPDHFEIFRKKDRKPVYSPWRLYEFDTEYVARQNDGIMDYTDNECDEILSIVKTNLNLSNNKQKIIVESQPRDNLQFSNCFGTNYE